MKVKNIRRTFLKQGTCSKTFFYLLDREFDHPSISEEQAADPLAGGILRMGHQCGMLWGASLAIGSEAYRRARNLEEAIILAVKGTQHVIKSFIERTETVNCREITKTDWNNKWSMAKYFIKGGPVKCFNLAANWAPEAIEAALQGLNEEPGSIEKPVSCACEVAKQLGATQEQTVMVAGFAGGLGLSGNGCGALSAAIWMKTLNWSKNNPGKNSYDNPMANQTLNDFLDKTGNKILCRNITNQAFKSLDEHSNFIRNGGCKELIDLLSSNKNQKVTT